MRALRPLEETTVWRDGEVIRVDQFHRVKTLQPVAPLPEPALHEMTREEIAAKWLETAAEIKAKHGLPEEEEPFEL